MLHFNSLLLYWTRQSVFSHARVCSKLSASFLKLLLPVCLVQIPEVTGAFLREIESITAGSKSQRPQRQKHHRRVLQADSREALIIHNQPFATTLSSNCCTEGEKEKTEKNPSGFVSLSNNLTFKHVADCVRHLQIALCSEVIIRLLVALTVNKTVRGSNKCISCVSTNAVHSLPLVEIRRSAPEVVVLVHLQCGGWRRFTEMKPS